MTIFGDLRSHNTCCRNVCISKLIMIIIKIRARAYGYRYRVPGTRTAYARFYFLR